MQKEQLLIVQGEALNPEAFLHQSHPVEHPVEHINQGAFPTARAHQGVQAQTPAHIAAAQKDPLYPYHFLYHLGTVITVMLHQLEAWLNL